MLSVVMHGFRRTSVPGDGNCALHALLFILKGLDTPVYFTCRGLRAKLKTLITHARPMNFKCNCDVHPNCQCRMFSDLTSIDVVASKQYFVDTDELYRLADSLCVSLIFINSRYGKQSLLVGENNTDVLRKVAMVFCDQSTEHYEPIVELSTGKSTFLFDELPHDVRDKIVHMNSVIDRCPMRREDDIQSSQEENQERQYEETVFVHMKTTPGMNKKSWSLTCTPTLPKRKRVDQGDSLYRIRLQKTQYWSTCIHNMNHEHRMMISKFFNRTMSPETESDHGSGDETDDEMEQKTRKTKKTIQVACGDLVCVAFRGDTDKTEYGPAIVTNILKGKRKLVCRWMKCDKEFKRDFEIYESQSYQMPLDSINHHISPKNVTWFDFQLMSNYTLALMCLDLGR